MIARERGADGLNKLASMRAQKTSFVANKFSHDVQYCFQLKTKPYEDRRQYRFRLLTIFLRVDDGK
jgi:hypothetical protein